METAGRAQPGAEEEKEALEALSPDFLEHSLPEAETATRGAMVAWELVARGALEPGSLEEFPPGTALRPSAPPLASLFDER